MSREWPGWQFDQKLAALYAPRILAAFSDSVDTLAMARVWAALHPDAVAKASPGEAFRAFVNQARAKLVARLKPVLAQLYAEAWVLGQQAAKSLLTRSVPVDWANWTPGDYEAAEQIAGPGLRFLLERANITIKSIADARLEELSQVLEDTLRSDVTRRPETGPLPPQLSVGDLARQLKTVLDIPGRAELVAVTEIARAQAEAAHAIYMESGLAEFDVSTAEDERVCPVCEHAEETNPHAIGTVVLPLHPRCRCAPVPPLGHGEGPFDGE